MGFCIKINTKYARILINLVMQNSPITKSEICDILTQDSYYRKLQRWPLLTVTSKNILSMDNTTSRKISEMFKIDYHWGHLPHMRSRTIEQISEEINEYFLFTDDLLLKYNNHLVACGGAIARAIHGSYGLLAYCDIDLFFYNLTVEEADKLRVEAVEYLIALWTTKGCVSCHVKRNEYTTTLIVDDGNSLIEYQFIHRIYPTIDSIIGGFDLSVCMVAYDGKDIYATPLGAWSIENRSIIIDTKRRSTSFEYRLQKYQHGFRLIFPGISDKLVNEFDDKTNDLYKKLAADEGYEDMFNPSNPNFFSRYSLQKKEDILPYFKLLNYNRIHSTPSDHKNIEDRFITKISDYSSLAAHPKFFADINAQQLRSENLHAVCSILKIDTEKSIREQLLNDVNNPNLLFNDTVISKFRERVDKVRQPFTHRFDGYVDIENQNVDFYRVLKCFGKLTPKVIEVRDTDEYYHYRDIIIDKMIANAEICKKNLTGVKWITQDPGRQWTSSINPIIANPREWYGKHYEPVITGIPPEIESTLRLMRLPKTESVWTMLNDDVFKVICLHLLKCYADEAWKYI